VKLVSLVNKGVNFREDFLEDIDLMLKSKLKDVEAEAFKYFFFG